MGSIPTEHVLGRPAAHVVISMNSLGVCELRLWLSLDSYELKQQVVLANPSFASHVRELSLRAIFANLPCYLLVIRLILSLRVGSVRVVGQKPESFLRLRLLATDV